MITCPTCANRMVTYGTDWRVCLACSVFDRATPDRLDTRDHAPHERRLADPATEAAPREVAGAWQS